MTSAAADVVSVPGVELIHFNRVNIMVADALDPCVTRSSAAMMLTNVE